MKNFWLAPITLYLLSATTFSALGAETASESADCRANANLAYRSSKTGTNCEIDEPGQSASYAVSPSPEVLLSVHGIQTDDDCKSALIPQSQREPNSALARAHLLAQNTASSASSSNSATQAPVTGPNPPSSSTTNPAGSLTPTFKPVANPATPFAPEGAVERGLPAPLDSVFPGTEWVGQPVIGAADLDPVWPLETAIYKACPLLKKARIKIYGWGNPGVGYSSSHHSNIPLTYAIVPRHLEMEQLVLRLERTPDTVQTEHMDWGFRVSNIYGIDYRWMAAAGWNPAGNELLKHNSLYGYDPVELYGQIYIPKVKQGMMIRFGRYISPPDIEAQLAPDNYLWTHSIMFTFDAYTHTGVQTSVKLSDQWMAQVGIHAGSDMAPWFRGAIPTLESYLRWTSKSNNDSIYGGIDALNNGRFRLAREVVQTQQETAALNALTGQSLMPAPIAAHDNLQQFNLTWGHRFNRRWHTMTEGYFLYSFDALQGGTVNNGPPRNYNALTGPGPLLPGMSKAWGFVNYTNCKITDKDYITFRPVDFLIDARGWRTGFPTTFASWTVGWCHRFSDLLCIRPEIRYERAITNHDGVIIKPYDNGTRRFQFTFGLDLIQRF